MIARVQPAAATAAPTTSANSPCTTIAGGGAAERGELAVERQLKVDPLAQAHAADPHQLVVGRRRAHRSQARGRPPRPPAPTAASAHDRCLRLSGTGCRRGIQTGGELDREPEAPRAGRADSREPGAPSRDRLNGAVKERHHDAGDMQPIQVHMWVLISSR